MMSSVFSYTESICERFNSEPCCKTIHPALFWLRRKIYCNACNDNELPSQCVPFPPYPVLHSQVKLPCVLLHSAFSWQLLVPLAHSSTSENILFKVLLSAALHNNLFVYGLSKLMLAPLNPVVRLN